METMTKTANRMVLSDGMADEHYTLTARMNASRRVLRSQDHQLPGHYSAVLNFWLPVVAVDAAVLATGWAASAMFGDVMKPIAALVALVFTFVIHVKWTDDWGPEADSKIRAQEGERYESILTDMNTWVGILREQAKRENMGDLVVGRRAALNLGDKRIKARMDRDRAARIAAWEAERQRRNAEQAAARKRHEEMQASAGMTRWTEPYEVSSLYSSYDREAYHSTAHDEYMREMTFDCVSDDYDKSPMEKLYLVSESGKVSKLRIAPEGDVVVVKMV